MLLPHTPAKPDCRITALRYMITKLDLYSFTLSTRPPPFARLQMHSSCIFPIFINIITSASLPNRDHLCCEAFSHL